MANDNDDACDHTFFLDIPVDTTTIPKQNMIDGDGRPVHGLDHLVDSYIKTKVRLPSGKKELYG